MNIPPILLLALGVTFALAYTCIITFGWAKTRKNRREIQEKTAIEYLPTLVLDPSLKNSPKKKKSISLNKNNFIDKTGRKINPEDYDAYIAIGKTGNIKDGNLLFCRKGTKEISYIFEVPNLKEYR